MEKHVSILLPTYNGSAWIGASIESVLEQTYVGWELIVIDDGSTDETSRIVHEYIDKDSRIRYIKNESNLGIQKSLNRGLQEAKGEYIARIDDDDLWVDRNKLLKQVTFLKENPAYILVGTGAVVVDEEGKELTHYMLPENDGSIRSKMLSKNCFIHSSVVFRKDTVADGYNEMEEMAYIEDYDLWLRLGIAGKIANLPMHGVSLMVRGGTLTSKNRLIQARHMIARMKKSRKEYPNFITGYCISLARVLFFSCARYIPFNKEFFYILQSAYKKL